MAIRVYVNTSVYKGAVDLAINAASQECVTQDKAGSLQWVVSEIVVDEL